MQSVISISGLSKTYKSGVQALKPIDLEIGKSEIFALLGPNGAGKTTLINIVCGLVTPSTGSVTVNGHDTVRDYRAARAAIGLVPQELAVDMFEAVWPSVRFSRGLFGCALDDARLEKLLRQLTLWDKRKSMIRELSGGMKRRVMIAKALSHEPEILFLDEPTAGVDVELRREMWALVHELRAGGVTIILTTHYIEEAEEMADRVGVISRGELILVEDKAALMKKLGKRELTLALADPIQTLPCELSEWPMEIADGGHALVLSFDAQADHSDIPSLLRRLDELGIAFKDLRTRESSLEDIFVELLRDRRAA